MLNESGLWNSDAIERQLAHVDTDSVRRAYRLIHCDKDKSVGDPEAGNLLGEADNLGALKALLPITPAT